MVAAGSGITGIGFVKACVVGGGSLARAGSSQFDHGTVIAVIVIIVAVIILVAIIGRAVKKRDAEARVKRLDPELWELFQKLDRDHKQGRL